jgi:hypothetical protein
VKESSTTGRKSKAESWVNCYEYTKAVKEEKTQETCSSDIVLDVNFEDAERDY